LAPITVDTIGFLAGDVVEIDLDQGLVVNKTQGFERTFSPLPDVMRTILSSGGLVAHINKVGSLALETEN
jgi:3-isopropylmalate/(R)-2-methylmalate dehydratase small subunit